MRNDPFGRGTDIATFPERFDTNISRDTVIHTIKEEIQESRRQQLLTEEYDENSQKSAIALTFAALLSAVSPAPANASSFGTSAPSQWKDGSASAEISCSIINSYKPCTCGINLDYVKAHCMKDDH